MNDLLLKAAECGDSRSVKKLLRKAALLDINVKDDLGRSAVSLAAKGQYIVYSCRELRIH